MFDAAKLSDEEVAALNFALDRGVGSEAEYHWKQSLKDAADAIFVAVRREWLGRNLNHQQFQRKFKIVEIEE